MTIEIYLIRLINQISRIDCDKISEQKFFLLLFQSKDKMTDVFHIKFHCHMFFSVKKSTIKQFFFLAEAKSGKK